MHRVDNATYLTSDDRAEQPAFRALTGRELRDLYAYPHGSTTPWIRVNFVSSIDGAVSVGGLSGALGTPADKQVFGILRELADVIVVGAGTARAENYGGVRISEAGRARRRGLGQPPVPPVAVVSARGNVDPHSRLFTDTEIAPLVITCSDADPKHLEQLSAADADVIMAGTERVTTQGLIAALAGRGFTRVLCEGGPGLLGQLIADDAVDDLCLTTAPLLVGGDAGRIASSPRSGSIAMVPRHILGDSDGTSLTRWVRAPRPK